MKNLTKEAIRTARPGIIEWWAKDEQTGAGWKGTIEFPHYYSGDIRTTTRNGDFLNLINYHEIAYRDELLWFDPETGTKSPIYYGPIGSCPFNIYQVEYYPIGGIIDASIKKELAAESQEVIEKWIEKHLKPDQLRRESKINKLF